MYRAAAVVNLLREDADTLMMRPKLVLIEGLPGSGKTTTAQLVHEIFKDMNIKSQLFVEGDPSHPADYEGVACFTKNEFEALCNEHEKFRDLLVDHLSRQSDHYFLDYRIMINESNAILPDKMLDTILTKDIYELTFDQSRELIVSKWKNFAESALNSADIFIFECCFMQNPVTMGMIKYNEREEEVIGYVMELAEIVERLNPLLIYVKQNNLDHSFRKAINDRPEEWSKGFIEYYTNQGYGKIHGLQGLEGTLQVLIARREVEEKIMNRLQIPLKKIDNSPYNKNEYKQSLVELLSEHFRSTNE